MVAHVSHSWRNQQDFAKEEDNTAGTNEKGLRALLSPSKNCGCTAGWVARLKFSQLLKQVGPPRLTASSFLHPIDCSWGQCVQCVSVHKVNPLRSDADPRAAWLSDLKPSSSLRVKLRDTGTHLHPSIGSIGGPSMSRARLPEIMTDPPPPARTIARRRCRQSVLAY